MSRRQKKGISLIVLVSFVALLLPKSLWHDCSHEHAKTEHSSNTSKTVIDQGVEKCYACDLHLPLLSNPVGTYHPFERFFAADSFHAVPKAIVFGIADIQTLRGPPAGMI